MEGTPVVRLTKKDREKDKYRDKIVEGRCRQSALRTQLE